MSDPAQSLAVKRAQVDFHNFASLGEPERALAAYADENMRRGSILRTNLDFIGSLTPFLEVGANAGHTSYLLANDFQADGFALDLSADALRHGQFLREARCVLLGVSVALEYFAQLLRRGGCHPIFSPDEPHNAYGSTKRSWFGLIQRRQGVVAAKQVVHS